MDFGKWRRVLPERSQPNPAGTAFCPTQQAAAASSSSRFLRPQQAGFGEVADPYARFSTPRTKSSGTGQEPLNRVKQNVHIENRFGHIVIEAHREIFLAIAHH